jgi:hypothetical protein
MSSMATVDDRLAAQRLAEQAHDVVRYPGGEPFREALKWLSRGRWGRRRGWPVLPEPDSPWQDTVCSERDGWRTRRANLPDEPSVFAVDYVICRRCGLGWVEGPSTHPDYQRCGLAGAGLAALRDEYPGIGWYTLGGHFIESRPFWSTVSTGVPGGYEQQSLCAHTPLG